MKWKPFTKRLLSLILAAAMLAGILPVTSLAAEADESTAQPQATEYTYTLIFNGNGEGVTNVPASKTITTSEPETMFTVQPDDDNVTRPGYKFLNWNNKADGTGDITVRGGLGGVKVTKDNPTVTLYAQWQVDSTIPSLPTLTTYSIVYHGNVDDDSVTNLPDPESFTSPAETYNFTVSRVTPVREGYDFLHWYDNPECTGQYKGLGWTLTATKDNPTIHLYAKWTEHVHVHEWQWTINGEGKDGTHSAVCVSEENCGETIDNEPHTWNSGSVTTQPTLTEPGVRTYTCTKCGATYTEAVPVVVPNVPTLSEVRQLNSGNGVVRVVENYNVNADGTAGPAKELHSLYLKKILKAPDNAEQYSITEPVLNEDGSAYYCYLTIKASTIQAWIDEFCDLAYDTDEWAVDWVHSDYTSLQDVTLELEYKYQMSWHLSSKNASAVTIYMIHTNHTFPGYTEDEEKGIAYRQCERYDYIESRLHTYQCHYIDIKPLAIDAAKAAEILGDLKISLNCLTDGTSAAAALDPKSLTVGELVAGENGVYTCTVTLDCTQYLDADHTLADGQNETVTVSLTWTPNAARDNGTWSAETSEIIINVNHAENAPELPTASYLQNLTRGYVIYVVENYNVLSDGTPGPVKTSSSPRNWRFRAIPNTYTLSEVEYRDGAFYCTLTIIDLEPYVDGFLEEYETSTDKYTMDTVHTDAASFTYELKWNGSSWQYDESNGFNAADGKYLYMYHTKHTSTGKWTIVKAATCEEDGVQTKQCTHLAGARQSTTQCQYIITETIPATGHTWGEWEVTKEATCTEEGEKTRVCSVCGKTETEAIPAAGHDWGEWTCDEENHTRECSVCHETETGAHEWDKGVVTTAPTLTEEGVKTFTCSVCGSTKTEAIPVPVPVTNEIVESDRQPGFIYILENCKPAGQAPKYIGNINNDTTGRQVTSRKLIPGTYSIGEPYEENGKFYCVVTITNIQAYLEAFQAKYTDANYIIDTANSLSSYQYVLEYIGYDYPSDPCPWRYVRMLNDDEGRNTNRLWITHVHYADEMTVIKAANCGEPGIQEGVCKHCYKLKPSTISSYNCRQTFQEEIPATGEHTWGEWEITKEATCTEDGEKTRTCSVCGKTETDVIPAAGHDWGEWEITKEATCTEDGEKTRTCSVCGETETEVIPATGHDWDEGKVTTEATCTKEGVKTYTCKNDPTHTKTETIPMKEHTFTKWESDETKHWRECTVCGKKEEGKHVDANNNGICDVCGAKVAKSDIAPKTGDPTPVKTIVTVLVISAVAICAIVLYLFWKKKKASDQ